MRNACRKIFMNSVSQWELYFVFCPRMQILHKTVLSDAYGCVGINPTVNTGRLWHKDEFEMGALREHGKA